MKVDYNGKKFRSVSNAASGEVGSETIFHCHQADNIVWAEYSGGAIVRGQLVAICDENCVLDMRYQHVNTSGELMTGECFSTPEVLADGRIRLYEKWKWTSGDKSAGESVIEEITDP